MTWTGLILQLLIVAYLILVEPFYGKHVYDEMLRQADTDPSVRTRGYRRIALMEWGLTALTLLSLRLRKETLAALGLNGWRVENPIVLLIAAGLLTGMLLSVLLAALSARARQNFKRQLSGAKGIIPTTPAQRWQFAGLAITAGICEEALYRGLMVMLFQSFFPGAAPWLLVTVLALVFGLGHWYQGWQGVIVTGLFGAVMVVLYLFTGTLWPAMLLHALVDLRALGLAMVIARFRTRDAAA